MPFTVSHVVAVLPLTTRRSARWLDVTGLVIGSMVPDVPLFATFLGSYGLSHDLLLGPISYDLGVGLLVFALWTWALRRPLTDLASVGLRSRLPIPRPVRGLDWARVALSLVGGAYTHLLWDSFTHANRWGTRHLPVLNVHLGPLPVFKYLQYGCGLAGLVVLAWWLTRWWRRTATRPRQASPIGPGWQRLSWIATLVAAAVGASVAGATRAAAGASTGVALVAAARGAGAVVAAAIVLYCLGWWWAYGIARPGPTSRPSRPGEPRRPTIDPSSS